MVLEKDTRDMYREYPWNIACLKECFISRSVCSQLFVDTCKGKHNKVKTVRENS